MSETKRTVATALAYDSVKFVRLEIRGLLPKVYFGIIVVIVVTGRYSKMVWLQNVVEETTRIVWRKNREGWYWGRDVIVRRCIKNEVFIATETGGIMFEVRKWLSPALLLYRQQALPSTSPRIFQRSRRHHSTLCDRRKSRPKLDCATRPSSSRLCVCDILRKRVQQGKGCAHHGSPLARGIA